MTPGSAKGSEVLLAYQDEAVLRAIARYHFLTSRQVCRLQYSPKSITYVQSRLKRLTELGYLQRIWIPKRGRFGSAPAVYTLARLGLNHLIAVGVNVRPRYHPSEQEKKSYLFLDHTLELNDFLISAELLGRWRPEFRLAGMVHERELKRRPIWVETPSGKLAIVIPDAWLDVRIQESFQVCLVVELDRGTEEQKRWRQKIANLIAYANGPYQEAFATRSLTYAIVTTAGSWRLMDLQKWTRAELESSKELSMADLFLFTSLETSQMDPETVFLSPRWYRPFNPEPIALLETNWVY